MSLLVGWVIGPTLKYIERIGLSGERVVLSTGTYSYRPLHWLATTCTAAAVDFMGRLDLKDSRDWVNGSVDPRGLLDFAEKLQRNGTRVRLFVSPYAHAKVYVGSIGVLMGSANLSLRGFGAGPEIVYWYPKKYVARALAALDTYSRRLEQIDSDILKRYVARYGRLVSRRRSTRKTWEDRLPSVRVQSRQTGVGSYPGFLSWCRRRGIPAANEIALRAAGKGNLQGHIHRNFYGIRQYLIANPDEERRLAREDSSRYRVFGDPGMEPRLKRFVERNATDELDFPLRIWETYLPRELGGRAGKRGGSIGNLNRMFPLVASYLRSL